VILPSVMSRFPEFLIMFGPKTAQATFRQTDWFPYGYLERALAAGSATDQEIGAARSGFWDNGGSLTVGRLRMREHGPQWGTLSGCS
jgi:hypothetical protein